MDKPHYRPSNTEDLSEGGTGAPTTGLGGLAVPLGVHIDMIRQNDLRFDAERDRRLTEVAVEREKALAIKEKADEKALMLDSEIRKYKDEKANELREQLASERTGYASKDDLQATAAKSADDLGGAVKELKAIILPIQEFVLRQQGVQVHGTQQQPWHLWIAGAVFTVVILAATGKLW